MLKKVLTLNELFDQLEQSRINRFTKILDKFTFVRILLFWTTVIILFGLFYYFFSSSTNYLYYTPTKKPAEGLLNYIYFSFITATSTGFGDIIPKGYFRVISILEVVFGLLLLAFVTSKLVSLKQDVILSEIYDISFKEKINRVRSSLLLFRQNLNKLINGLEEKTFRLRELEDIYVYLSSFEDILQETYTLMHHSGNHYTKSVNAVDAELIFNSILQSFEKMLELIQMLDKEKYEWRKEITTSYIHKCLELNKDLLKKMNKGIARTTRENIIRRYRKLKEELEKELQVEKTN